MKTNVKIKSLNCVLGEKEEECHAKETRVANSTRKGQQLEQDLAHALEQYLPFLHVESTAKQTASGDLWLTYGQNKEYSEESKNYSHKLPRKEIEKFQRDIHTRKPHGAILFSEGTPRGARSMLVANNLRSIHPTVYYVENGDFKALQRAVFLIAQIETVAAGDEAGLVSEFMEQVSPVFSMYNNFVLGVEQTLKEYKRQSMGVTQSCVEFVTSLQSQIPNIETEKFHSLLKKRKRF